MSVPDDNIKVTEKEKSMIANKYKTVQIRAYGIRAGMVLLDGGEVSKVEILPDRNIRLSFTHSASFTVARDKRFSHYPNMAR
jgi:hypothetical protein